MGEQEFLAGYTEGWWNYAKRNRVLVRKYNTMDPLDLRGKFDVLLELLGSVDEDSVIEPPFYCDNGKNIFIGRHFYANYNFTVLDAARVSIGENVLIGPNVTIACATHPIHPESRVEGGFPILTAPVTIGDNCWLGAGVTVLPGVTIGSGCVIGAHALVNRDIPANSVAAGTPCRVLRAVREDDRVNWGGREEKQLEQ